MPVLSEDTEEVLGTIDGILIDPDTGKVEGFFVRVPHFLTSKTLFLSGSDIARFGRRITVRHAHVLAPPEEFLRVAPLLADRRTVLGQRVRTESGRSLGRCRDVQFDTTFLTLSWVFPRRFLRSLRPISVKEIVEVRPKAIIIRDPPAPAVERVMEAAQRGVLPLLPEGA